MRPHVAADRFPIATATAAVHISHGPMPARPTSSSTSGATTSLENLLKDLEKAGTHIKRETLNRYIGILKDAKILYECNRFELKC